MVAAAHRIEVKDPDVVAGNRVWSFLGESPDRVRQTAVQVADCDWEKGLVDYDWRRGPSLAQREKRWVFKEGFQRIEDLQTRTETVPDQGNGVTALEISIVMDVNGIRATMVAVIRGTVVLIPHDAEEGTLPGVGVIFAHDGKIIVPIPSDTSGLRVDAISQTEIEFENRPKRYRENTARYKTVLIQGTIMTTVDFVAVFDPSKIEVENVPNP